jgi:hypothetical protein
MATVTNPSERVSVGTGLPNSIASGGIGLIALVSASENVKGVIIHAIARSASGTCHFIVDDVAGPAFALDGYLSHVKMYFEPGVKVDCENEASNLMTVFYEVVQ